MQRLSGCARTFALIALLPLGACVADGGGSAGGPQAFASRTEDGSTSGSGMPTELQAPGVLFADNAMVLDGETGSASSRQASLSLQDAPRAPEGASIRFTPVIGAPLEAVTPLSEGLRNAATGGGLSIKASSDPTSDHVLKGYLAAEPAENTTLVIYVWDVLDGAGNRIHRIRGVEEVAAVETGTGEEAASAWAAVPSQTMERIAERTIADYLSWRQLEAV